MTLLHHPTKGAVDLSAVDWTNPGNGGIQYATTDRIGDDGQVETLHLMRKDPSTLTDDDEDTTLLFDQDEWDAFIAGARDGEFDPGTFDTTAE